MTCSRYVDQGSQAMLDLSQLRHLASEFRTVPCQAVPAALAGVCPLQGDWTPEDNYWFNTRYALKHAQPIFHINYHDCRVAGRKFQGTVVQTLSDKIVVDLKDEESDSHVCQQLISNGRGKLQIPFNTRKKLVK